MSLIEVKKLSKIYGKEDNKTIALDNISFTIESGEFVAIIGASRKWKIYTFAYARWSRSPNKWRGTI